MSKVWIRYRNLYLRTASCEIIELRGMRKLSFILALSLFAIALEATTLKAQSMKSVTAETLLAMTQSPDTVYVVNFWATWCRPCVEELPEFNKLAKQYEGKPVKVLLVSLDFQESYPKKLIDFSKKKKLIPEIVWFSETNANEFIPKIAPQWTGSIPATLIVAPLPFGKIFLEGSTTAEKLSESIEAILSNIGG